MTGEFSGRPPQSEDAFWKKTILERIGESIPSIEQSARHLIVAAIFLEGVYFHTLSFADPEVVFGTVENTALHWLLAFLFSAPVLIWLIVFLLHSDGACDKAV